MKPSCILFRATALTLISMTGCGTTMTAVPLSQTAKLDGGSGIPYYLPRPYLIISYNFSIKGTQTTSIKTTTVIEANEADPKKGEDAKKLAEDKNKAATTSAAVEAAAGGTTTVEQIVTVPTVIVPDPAKPQFLYEWVYLPDMEQKYGLQYERGTGTSELHFEFKDGWMLTGINSKSDAKTAETITAAGTAIGSAVGAALGNPLAGAAAPTDPTPPDSDTAKKLAEFRIAQLQNLIAKSGDTENKLWIYRLNNDGRLQLIENWKPKEEEPHFPRPAVVPPTGDLPTIPPAVVPKPHP